ncbi:MAG: DUF3179 domain-containing protein [Devosiaceae bacterium]|nr:DUF3179 domain-containing protein [Devosiaceae bacterium MH13]
MTRAATPVWIRLLAPLMLLCFGAAAHPAAAQDAAPPDLPDYVIEQFGSPPPIPTGAISPELDAALRTTFIDLFDTGRWGMAQQVALEEIVQSGDPRAAWVMTDMMRFASNQSFDLSIAVATSRLLGVDISSLNHWSQMTDHLMAWDMPSFPGYLEFKRAIFTGFVPGWDDIFVEGDIDWRLVSWGGVLIDARPFGTTDEPCNCIPAADDPEVLTVAEAADAGFPADDDVIFGIEIAGESRAYPRQIMEVREMVNDTLGGRDLGIPYCTLCGAAQAYFTDRMPEGVARPVLRTSGLLIRSNKVMYDITSGSVFDTFRGNAVTGPLSEIGLVLDQATVVTTTWGQWKEAHPETTVLAERYALGRNPDFRNGRDADGPIFPVGDVDPRLPVHEDVIGVIAPSGTPWAFSRASAMTALLAGEEIAVETVRLELDGGGIRAVDADGGDLFSHEAFWFAWSQFYPETELWGQ